MKQAVVPARRFRKWAVAAGLALLAGVAVAVIDPFADRQALNDDQLDTLRGGYESAQGLVFSFGIERAVVVNGELLATTRLVIDNFGALLSGQPGAMQIVAETQSAVPGPSAPSGAVSTPATVQVQPAASSANPSVPTPTSIAAASSGTPLGGVANPAAATGSYAAISGTPPQSQAATSTGVTSLSPAPVPSASSVAPVTSTPAPVAASGVSAPPSSVASAPSTVSTGTTPASVSTSGMGGTPVAANTTQPASTASTASPSTSASAQTAGPVGTPASASSSTAAPSQAASQATAPTSPASAGTSALYVQVNAAGTVILIPNGAALAASVQNSANDTRIQMSTQIDAVLSSLSAYRAGVIADAARQAAFARP